MTDTAYLYQYFLDKSSSDKTTVSNPQKKGTKTLGKEAEHDGKSAERSQKPRV